MEGSQKLPTLVESLQKGQQQAKAGIDQIVAIATTIKVLIMFVAGVFASCVEVFLRSQFGERYFTFPRFLLTLVGVPFLATFMIPQKQMPAVAYFMIAYFFAALLQFRMILYRNLRGERWYSRSSGVSWGVWARLPKGDNLWVVSIVYEPLLCLVAAAILGRTGCGPLLLGAGLALAIKAYLEYRFQRERVLDAVDAQIESKYIAESLSPQKSVKHTEGYVVPPSLPWMKGYNEKPASAVVPSVVLENKLAKVDGGVPNSIVPIDEEPTTAMTKPGRPFETP